MASTSLSVRLDDEQMARLKRVMAKYSSNQTQALVLGLTLLDTYPAFQVPVPARRKPGPKTKGKPAQ